MLISMIQISLYLKIRMLLQNTLFLINTRRTPTDSMDSNWLQLMFIHLFQDSYFGAMKIFLGFIIENIILILLKKNIKH